MHVKWTKLFGLALVTAAIVLAPSARLFAACSPGVSVGFVTGNVYFNGCGDTAPEAFAWRHHFGLQRIVAASSNGTGAAGGHDSGGLSVNTTPNLVLKGSDFALPGTYFPSFATDTAGIDGCPQNAGLNEVGATNLCGAAGNPNFVWGPIDLVIAAIDPTVDPDNVRMAVMSVDFNSGSQTWNTDQAGAPVGAPACTGDSSLTVNCAPIPKPAYAGSGGCTASACNMQLTFGDASGFAQGGAIATDCQVAENRAINCTGGARDLYGGRILMGKRGPCTPGTGAALDRRAFILPASGPSNVAVPGNFFPISSEDANLNGILDPGEDGANGTANGVLDPINIDNLGAGPATLSQPNFCATGSGPGLRNCTIKIPIVPGANDCLYLATGVVLDPNAPNSFVDAPTNTIHSEVVLAPLVSLNPKPFRSGSLTPASDSVINLVASKTGGKAVVSWGTDAEFTTAGFNLIGTKKGGGEVKLNSTTIAAKQGTTGNSAKYSVDLTAAQLKGSDQVFVEMLRTDNTTERFGPAPIR